MQQKAASICLQSISFKLTDKTQFARNTSIHMVRVLFWLSQFPLGSVLIFETRTKKISWIESSIPLAWRTQCILWTHTHTAEGEKKSTHRFSSRWTDYSHWEALDRAHFIRFIQNAGWIRNREKKKWREASQAPTENQLENSNWNQLKTERCNDWTESTKYWKVYHWMNRSLEKECVGEGGERWNGATGSCCL